MADHPPGHRLLELVAVMDRLRSPGGCPWDAEQTHRSLATYLLEETYETLEAIDTGNDADLLEELGDLLLQVVFHARIAQERPEAAWTIDDVAGGIVEKLIRRHPHVFDPPDARATAGVGADVSSAPGAADVPSAPADTAGDAFDGVGPDVPAVDLPVGAELDARWEAIKRAEKQRTSALDGVPLAQPALSLASKVLHRVAKAGVDVPVPAVEVPATTDAESVGDTLLALVAQARQAGVDPEQALRDATRRYADAVREAEATPPT